MLAIARALMSRPQLLLCDEPSLGLAPFLVDEIFDIIRRINAEQGVAVLLVEQNAVAALDLVQSAYLIEQGRIIYSNIRKFVYFLLACNVGEILIIFGAMLFGMPIPLRPVHLLWLNLVSDGAPALALGERREALLLPARTAEALEQHLGAFPVGCGEQLHAHQDRPGRADRMTE